MSAEPPPAPTRASPARASRTRRAARAALAGCAALLCIALALGGLGLALSRGLQRERLRGWVEAALARALGAQVELAALEGPLYPRLELRGLRIAAADGSRLAAARIAVHCAQLCGWREGRLELAQLRLEQLALELSPAAAAKLQGGGDEPGAKRAGLPLAVRIGSLELAGAELALPYASWLPPQAAPAAGAAGGPAGAAAALPTELAATRSSPEPAPLTRVALSGSLRELWLLPQGVRWPHSGALELRAGPLQLRGRRIAQLTTKLELGPDRLRAAPLELQSDAGALHQGELQLQLGAGAAQPGAGALVAGLELRAQLDALDVAAWSGLPALRSALAGALELRARAAPQHGWTQPEFELQAQLRGAAAGAPLDALELRAHARGAHWELEHARARGLAISLEASGAGDAAGVSRLELQGDVARLDELLPPALAPWLGGGRASVQAQAAGAWRELAGTAALRAEQLRLGAGAPGSLEARLRARGGRIELEQLEYRGAGRAPESIRARGAWGPSGELALRADLAGIDLARLPPALRPPQSRAGAAPSQAGPPLLLAGALSGWLELSGTRTEPQLRAELSAARLRAGPLPESRAQLALTAAAGTAEGRFALDLQGPAELSGSFALPYSPAPPWPDPRALFHHSDARLELQGKALELEPLLALAGQDSRLASGALDVELHVRGEPSGPRLAGRLQLAGVSARSGGPGGGPLGPADGELRFEQLAPWHPAGPPLRVAGELAGARGSERWSLALALQLHHWLDRPRLSLQIEQLQASSGAQRMELSGELRGLRAEPLRVRVQALELQSWLPQQPRPAGGRLDAQFELRGPLLDGPALSGALTLAEPHYGDARADRLALEFGTNGGRFQASGHLEALGTLAARASLELPGPLGTRSLTELLADPAARLELRSERLDLRWLEPLAPVWLSDLEGALSADLQVRGAPDELALSGSLELSDAAAQVPLLSQRIGPLQASAHLENRALVLDQLHVEGPEGGVLQARGELALQQLRPSALQLRAQLADFPISSSGVASFAATGAVELAGPLTALVFSGDLSVREGRFAAPERGDPLWKEIRVLQASAGEPQFREGLAGNSLWEAARGRLRIAIPEDTWLRGRGAELEVTGEVELRKQPAQALRYFGELEVRRGSYQLGRQLLRVERGALQFTGSEQFDPLLDVLAVAELREHRVEVQLRGPLSEPSSELRSEPPLPRDDVLALLLFGIPSAELEQDRAAALSSVLALLGSELAVNDLRTRVARVLPFDTLGLETDASGTGTRLEVGRYVGKGIFVSYGRSVTGPTPQDAVGLEWRLTPSVSLKSETSSEGHTGADLIWRKDY